MSIQGINGGYRSVSFKALDATVAKNPLSTTPQPSAQLPTQDPSDAQKKSNLIKMVGAAIAVAGAVGGIIYAVRKGNVNKIEKLAQDETDKLTTLFKSHQLDIANSKSFDVIKSKLSGQRTEDLEEFHNLLGGVFESKLGKLGDKENKQKLLDFVSDKIKDKNDLKEINHILKEQGEFLNLARKYETLYEEVHTLTSKATIDDLCCYADEFETRTKYNNSGALLDTWKTLVKKHFSESEDGLIRPILKNLKESESPRVKSFLGDWSAKLKDLGATRSTKAEIIADTETHHIYCIDELYKPGDALVVTRPAWFLPNGTYIERGMAKVKE